MPWPRIIVHADMDAFYAAVEQLDHPELRGKPLLIGVDHPRSVVSTASYEARPFGVGSAMPMVMAKRLCPQAIVVPPRMARYAAISDLIMGVFADFSPRVEPLSLDEAFLDMTGTERVFGPPEALGRRLKQAVWQATGGLNVSVGVAACKYVAKVASDVAKPNGLLVVAPADQVAFLAPLPVSRLWGAGKQGAQRLKDLNLLTIADVAAADPAWLQARLGSFGAHVHALARADDPRPVVPDRDAQSIGSEATLDVDVTGHAAIEPHLLHAADRVARRLRRAGLRAGGVRLKLKTAQFKCLTRQVQLRPPADTASVLLREALLLLGHVDLSQRFRLIGLAAYELHADSEPVQGQLFDESERQRNRNLDRALDTLRQRFGANAVTRATDLRDREKIGISGRFDED